MSADLIFSVGSIIFILALLPAFRQPPAASTCFLTGLVLCAYAATYGSLELAYSLITTATLAGLWLALGVIALRVD